jgi:hypothetical protein
MDDKSPMRESSLQRWLENSKIAQAKSSSGPTCSIEVALEGTDALDHLTIPSRTHLTSRIGEFAIQVLREARAIEKSEHVGKGSPEITAAHIDEAWWVVRRRVRHSRHPVALIVTRIFQTVGSICAGLGMTYVQHPWGATTFVAAALVTLGSFLAEQLLARGE